jgi:hypothetical protein
VTGPFIQKLREDKSYFDRFASLLDDHAKKSFRGELRYPAGSVGEWPQYRSYLRCLEHASFCSVSVKTLNEIAARFGGVDFDTLCVKLLGPIVDERDVPAPDRATPAHKQWRKETKLLIPPRYEKHAELLWDFVRGDEKRPGTIPHPDAIAPVFRARRRKVRDDEKLQSLIIQQSFVTTVRPTADIQSFAGVGPAGAALLPPPAFILRIDRDGHSISKGSSVMQSMSEDFPPFACLRNYLSDLYCEEVTFTTEDPIGIRFLGVASNNHKGIRYLFFVFEVSIAEDIGLKLKVDSEDVATWIGREHYPELISRIATNRADLVVFRDLLRLKIPGDLDCGHARALFRGYPGDVVVNPALPDIEVDAKSIATASIDQWADASAPADRPGR